MVSGVNKDHQKIISILRHLHQSRNIINRESGVWTKTQETYANVSMFQEAALE